METAIRFDCVIRPPWLDGLVIATAILALAALIALPIAIRRRVQRTARGTPRPVRWMNRTLAAVVAVLTIAVLAAYVIDRRTLREYEATQQRAASHVRQAMNRDTRNLLAFAGGAAVIAALSTYAWRGAACAPTSAPPRATA